MSFEDKYAIEHVSRILEEHSYQSPRDSVWHYTAAPGLEAITQNKSIRTTHYSCFNDKMEVILGYELMLRAVRTKNSNGDGEFDDVAELLSSLGRLCLGEITPAIKYPPHSHPEAWITNTYEYYMACFSQADDDVSQWMTYAGGEGGYALGFDPDELRKPINLPPLTKVYFVPVVYKGSDQRYIVNRFLDRTIEDFRLAKIHDPDFNESYHHNHAAKWLTAFSALACIFKQEAFANEKEWRLLLCFSPLEQEEMLRKMQFTPKAGLFARHYPATFKNFPLKHVKIGPSRYQKVSERSLAYRLQQAGLHAQIELSNATYQTV
jgi:hypothetical protein